MANIQATIDGRSTLKRVEPGVDGTRTVRVVLESGTTDAVLVLTAGEARRLYRELGDAIGAKTLAADPGLAEPA